MPTNRTGLRPLSNRGKFNFYTHIKRPKNALEPGSGEVLEIFEKE